MQLGPDTPAGQDITNTQETQQDWQVEFSLPDAGTSESQPAGYGGLLERFNAENSLLPNILIIGAMVMLVFLMMRTLRKTSQANRARNNAMGTPSERMTEIREKAQQSMEPARKLMVDAEDVARRLGAVLDNKAARLELLIEEADAKLDRLNRAIAHAEGRSSGPEGTASAPGSTPSRTIDPSLLDRARVEQDFEERQSRVVGRISPESPKQPETDPIQEVSISDQIQTLALTGKSSKEIASELKQPIGQVELIMNLHKRADRS